MSNIVKFTIDGKECQAEAGITVVEAARNNNIYIPTLCNYRGLKPKAGCRICSVKINGRMGTSCSTPVTTGMVIENDTPEIQDKRKSIIELLFIGGNHFCPSCEQSGNCELQALGYRYSMMVPRFPYMFPTRQFEAGYKKITRDSNRCILCKRCVRAIKDDKGRSIFAYKERGNRTEIIVDPELEKTMSDELAQKAINVCPVGAILPREKGFIIPIDERRYEKTPIGSEIVQNK